MKFPIKSEGFVQTEKFTLDFQVWDKDLLSANDFIGSVTVPIWPVISACIANGNKALYNHQEDVELEVNTKATLNKGKKPKIRVSIECLTKNE